MSWLLLPAFLLVYWAADTGKGWLSSSAVVLVMEVGVAVPVMWVGVAICLCLLKPVRGLGVAVLHVAGVGVAARPVVFSWDPNIFFSPWRCWVVLSRAWLAWASPQHIAVTCISLEWSGWWHNFSKHFTNYSVFSACSEVKFWNGGGLHCPRYLLLLSPIPCHS